MAGVAKMVGMLPFELPSVLDSEHLQRAGAHFRGTRMSTMVPNEHRTNTHDRVDHPCAWRDHSTPSRVLVCPQHRALQLVSIEVVLGSRIEFQLSILSEVEVIAESGSTLSPSALGPPRYQLEHPTCTERE